MSFRFAGIATQLVRMFPNLGASKPPRTKLTLRTAYKPKPGAQRAPSTRMEKLVREIARQANKNQNN